MARQKGEEDFTIRMEITITASGKTTSPMELDNTTPQKAANMKASGKRRKDMARADKPGPITLYFRALINLTKKPVVSSITATENPTWEE